MYTLRTIQENEIIVNEELGDHYTLVRKESKLFEEWCLTASMTESSAKSCVAIIHAPKTYYKPLYLGNSYYVMTDEGKTFERILN